MRTLSTLLACFALLLLGVATPALAQQEEEESDEPQMEETIRRGEGEGEGPFERLIIRGATVIDGTGAPPRGPMDIVIEGDEIVAIESVGAPGQPADSSDRPQEATREIDAEGMFVTPGFVDTHVHTGGPTKAPQGAYSYKLWLGHGITTARGVPFGEFEWQLEEKRLSAENEIVAPHMIACARPGTGPEWEERSLNTPEAARAWVRYAEEEGVDCVKLGAEYPDLMKALVTEADSLGMHTVAHLDQMGVGRMTARRAAELGLDEMTHYYGLLESLLKDQSIQDWPADYNYNDEYDRFGEVARLWDQIHEPGSEEWNALIEDFREDHFFISPTMTIYLAGRNVMAARNADWHEDYTLPTQEAFFQPSPESHGSYFQNWTTADEVAWRNFYDVWMQFLDDYNDAGGRITVGSDAGFIYQLYGFGFVQEMELLQEAGLHPVEVIRSATLYGAESIFEPKERTGSPVEFGTIREGMRADVLVMERNPLEDFKTLYGTGAMRRNAETGETERVRALKYTIKDGIVYDAQQLLEDVRQMVAEAEEEQEDGGNAPTSSSEDGE